MEEINNRMGLSLVMDKHIHCAVGRHSMLSCANWNSRFAASLTGVVRETLLPTKHKYIYQNLNFRPM